MLKLDLLAKDGAVDILRRLCVGEARFKELNRIVPNVRTLSRRLTELQAEGLIEKARPHYRITGEGFMVTLKIAELEGWAGRGVAKPDPEELAKVRYG